MTRMGTGLAAAALVLSLAAGAFAEPGGWRIEGQPGGSPYRLSLAGLDGGAGYSFECRADGVLVTETGVTQLLDIKTGQKISDEPGGSITAGAAYLMLMTSPEQSPNFTPAVATPNRVRGWDLSIVLPKSDKQWRALPQAKMVSLMSTGWTGAVMLDGASRKVISDFVKGCGS